MFECKFTGFQNICLFVKTIRITREFKANMDTEKDDPLIVILGRSIMYIQFHEGLIQLPLVESRLVFSSDASASPQEIRDNVLIQQISMGTIYWVMLVFKIFPEVIDLVNNVP